MKPSTVFFLPAYSNSSRERVNTLEPLLERAGLAGVVAREDLVAVKVHFGEPGNTTFLRPPYVRAVVDAITALKGRPFLTDTNTLYVGRRTNSVKHLATAVAHGFDLDSVGAPVIIADGLRGNAGVSVALPPPGSGEVTVAPEIDASDALVVVTHFKGHLAYGFGGSIKNLGMGCTNRAGKMYVHALIAPSVDSRRCTGCGTCRKWCGYDAITVQRKRAKIDPGRCVGCAECLSVCPEHAVEISWKTKSREDPHRRLAEVARGVILGKEEKTLFLNFLLNVTPNCDCLPWSEPVIVADIGVLASRDPVAIDQASVDLVNAEEALPEAKLASGAEPGGDKFRGVFPKIPWHLQLEWGEKLGLGRRAYELVKVP